jgi:hypothetical protein
MHLDLTKIDLSAIEQLCLHNGLFGALIAAYNSKEPLSFDAPLFAIMSVVDSKEGGLEVKNSDIWTAASPVLLLYIGLCLRGRSFPNAGELEELPQSLALAQVLRALFLDPNRGAGVGARLILCFPKRIFSGQCLLLCHLSN